MDKNIVKKFNQKLLLNRYTRNKYKNLPSHSPSFKAKARCKVEIKTKGIKYCKTQADRTILAK